MTFKIRVCVLAVLLTGAGSIVSAQINIPSIINVLTDPSGICASPGTPLQYNTQLNHLSACQGASPGPYSWALVGAATGTTVTVASGTSALGTSAISSGACASTVTTSASGVAATDNIQADFNASPLSITGYAPTTGGILTIIKWPTSGGVNFAVCNFTANSITPQAVTLNWRVVR